MRVVITFLFLAIINFSCVDGPETPDPQSALDGELKIVVQPNYLSNYNELWVIIHDLSGQPIHSQQVINTDTITFALDDSQRYHLTSYRMAESFGNKIEFLESFTDIAVNEDITLGLFTPSSPIPPVTGEFTVNITDTQFPFGAYLTSRVGTSTSIINQTGSQIQMRMAYFSGIQDYLLVAKNSSGEGRYKLLSVPNPNTSLNFTFSELDKYDKVFKFEKEDFSQFYFTSVVLTEVEDNLVPGYIINSNMIGGNLSFDPIDAHEIGFLNRFENYEIVIQGNRSMNAKTSFSYRKIGPVPSSITLPQDQEIQVQKGGLNDFQFSMPSGTTNWVATWDQSEPFTNPPIATLRWIVSGSKPTLRLALPEDLTKEKPKLQDLSKFKLESIEALKHTFSYDKQIRNRIVEATKKEPLELTSLRQFYGF